MKETHRAAAGTSVALGAAGTTALMAAGHGVNDMFTGMVPALLPVFQTRFGLEESSLALLVGTFAFSSSFLGPFFGSLADRYGARLVAALAIAFTASFLSLPGLMTDASILLGLLALAGLGSAAFHPAGGAIVRESAGSRTGLAPRAVQCRRHARLRAGPDNCHVPRCRAWARGRHMAGVTRPSGCPDSLPVRAGNAGKGKTANGFR